MSNETTNATTVVPTSVPQLTQTTRRPPDPTTPPPSAGGSLIPLFPVAAILIILIAVFIFVVIVILMVRKYIKLRKKQTPVMCAWCEDSGENMCSEFTCCSPGGISCNSCQGKMEENKCCIYIIPDSRSLLDNCCPTRESCQTSCNLFWGSCFNCRCLQGRCDNCHICPDCSAMECPNFNCCGDCCQCTIRAPECTHVTCLCFECGRPPPAP